MTTNQTGNELTERQQRELEYHRGFAESNKEMLRQPVKYDVVEEGPRRWWNQYWAMYTYLINKDLTGKNVLVIGSGFGGDAMNLAKAGAKVQAFDLSPESVELSRQRASKEGLNIEYREMVAEKLDYEDNHFDIIVARDILHHVEIPKAFAEVIRVAKPGGILCFNEIYSHSLLHRIRYSKFIDQWLYPKMISFVHGSDKPYITEDEERLTEKEVNLLISKMQSVEERKYFNAFVTRIVPDRFPILGKIDQILLRALSPLAHMLGSRVLVGGVIK